MRLATLRNALRGIKRDAMAKTFVVIFGLGNVVGLGLWVSYVSFEFIESYPVGAALNSKLIGVLFFSLLILVILSTVIVAYTTLFLAKETFFFFQHPLHPRATFSVKATEAILFSSWATLFLCYPVLVSFGLLRDASWIYYVEALGILISFLLFAGLTGTSIAIAIAPIVRHLQTRQIVAFGVMLLAALGWVFLRSFRFWDMDGDNNLLILDRFASQVPFLQSPYFPGSWASTAVLAAASENHREVVFHGGVLLANTLFFLPFLSLYAARSYGRQWILSRTRAPDRQRDLERASEKSARLAGSPLRALVGKDMLVFLRDPAQLSQSILFVLLMVIYSLSLLRMPEYFTQNSFRFVIFFANLGAVCALLSSFTSRFLFPLISLEGRAFWIVGLAPVPRVYLLYQKAIFGLSLTLLLGVVTALVSNLALGYPVDLVLGAVYTIVLAGTCLTSLAIGLGAAYPNFLEDNPARIAVGLGGTLNFFASALSVAVLVGIEASPYLVQGITQRTAPSLKWVFLAHSAAFVFTLSLSAFCLHLGRRSLTRSEF